MTKRYDTLQLAIFAAAFLVLAPVAYASVPAVELNVSNPEKTQPLTLVVSAQESETRGWKPGRSVTLRAFVQGPDGKPRFVADMKGRTSWRATLEADGSAVIAVRPSAETYSGRVTVTADGVPVAGSRAIEKVHEYRFADGARVKIHFTDETLSAAGESAHFGRDVLDAAVQAYQTITEFQGFSTPGYSFTDPDRNYAYDPDATIDVFLGDPAGEAPESPAGFPQLSFKDAPCFDTVGRGKNRFDAVILLPSNYKEFIKNWESINPSPLGTRNVEVDLRGTLMHEMLHVILFYYNKNLNKDAELASTAPAHPATKKIDWYVEGLARYFETFAGARHDFFSQGFKQMLPDKIRFSRGGSNYFMRWPDQAFTDLRYENALFWRYIDHRFGMSAIERLSREFRECGRDDFVAALERATGKPFRELQKDFSLSILTKEFGLKGDSEFLKDIARTRLAWRSGGFFLVEGDGSERPLGPVCATDWIGLWSDVRSNRAAPPVAGDNSEKSDVSGWATDYYEIDVPQGEAAPRWLGVSHDAGAGPLAVQVLLETAGGSRLAVSIDDVPRGAAKGADLSEAVRRQGLASDAVRKIFVLVTNTDAKASSDYRIESRA